MAHHPGASRRCHNRRDANNNNNKSGLAAASSSSLLLAAALLIATTTTTAFSSFGSSFRFELLPTSVPTTRQQHPPSRRMTVVVASSTCPDDFAFVTTTTARLEEEEADHLHHHHHHPRRRTMPPPLSYRRSSTVSLPSSSPMSPSKAATSSSCTVGAAETQLSTAEAWCLDRLDAWYAKSQRVKCPFFRRRYGDALDHLETYVVRPLLVRRSSLDAGLFGPLQACKPVVMGGVAIGGGGGIGGGGSSTAAATMDEGRSRALHGNGHKSTGLPAPALMDALRRDWGVAAAHTTTHSPPLLHGDHMMTGSTSIKPATKGYYITGRLSASIYRDDCVFDSPDPDLPIQGLRKYVGVASQLFDSRASSSTLISLEQVPGSSSGDDDEVGSGKGDVPPPPAAIRASWKMNMTIKLPWRPQLPEFSGTTTYHLDHDHLIYRHEETWDDISVPDAFLAMFAIRSKKTRDAACPFGGAIQQLFSSLSLSSYRLHQEHQQQLLLQQVIGSTAMIQSNSTDVGNVGHFEVAT